MSGNNTDARVQIGTSYPGMTFPDEVQDGSSLGSACYKEFQHFYAQLEGLLRAAGINPDGTFNNLVAQSVTLVNNYNTSLPPTVGNNQTPGTIYTVSAGGVASQVGGAQCCPDVAGVGSLAFTNYGDTSDNYDWQFWSPQGVNLGPIPNPVVANGVSTVRALSDGRVVVIGDNSVAGPKIWQPDFSSYSAPSAGSNPVSYGIGLDSSGNIYGKASTNKIRKYDSTGAYVTEYTIPNCQNIFGVSVNPAGTVLYYSKVNVPAPAASTKEVYSYTIATTTEALFASDASYTAGFNSILVIPYTGDVLIGWDGGGTDGYIKHYDSTGALLYTYQPTVNGGNLSPVTITAGLTDFSFWVAGGANVDTDSGVIVAEVQMVTGAVLNQFAPDDGTDFYYGGPFCVLRAPIPALTS